MQPVFRFAPSPNGPLHLGHAFSALLNADLAKGANGRLLVRIDDIDRERCRPEFEAAIVEDCEWLGLNFERPVRRQTDHLHEYGNALDRLRELGLAYPAFMSRAEIARGVDADERNGRSWPRDPDGSPIYPGDDRSLAVAEANARIEAGAPHAIRLDVARAIALAGPLTWCEFRSDTFDEVEPIRAEPGQWGDVVLAGRDTTASYHLAVVIDDAAQDISHVVRGHDLQAATSIHRLLQTLLGLAEPVYHHHRLILDDEGRKLAKSDDDVGMAALRQNGFTSADIRRIVGLPV